MQRIPGTRLNGASLLASLAAGLIMLCALPNDAGAAPDRKKAIWGPVTQNGASLFPTYQDLGVGVFQYSIGWGNVAPTKPVNPTDPNDPAYQWIDELDFAISEAARYGMEMAVYLTQAPGWANGGNVGDAGRFFSPLDPKDFADFATAAARRYPSVKLWMIWGEPTIAGHFEPFNARTVPRRYAELLDAAYGALNAVDPANRVVGGNTITQGQIKPLTFMKRLRLPNGLPPRLDMWGHNAFSTRKPNLASNPRKPGTADVSDLDTMVEWLDRYVRKGKRNRKVKLYLSEWTIPTDHSGYLFNFWADRKTVANYLTRALKIARKLKRVYTLGWYQLYDEPPNAAKNNMNWGLLTHDGKAKPAYKAFKRG